MSEKYDFSGWVTKYNIKCTDGRTIRNNAFADMDGQRVPLVIQHVHDDPEKIIGFVDLEHHDGVGVYGYASLNQNPKAKAAKEAVAHGDIDSFSIYANHLQQKGGNVFHGEVKEVSLVLCGANAGAKIDYPVISHDGFVDFVEGLYIEDPDEMEDARIMFPNTIEHSDSEEQEMLDIYESMNEDQKDAVAWYVGQALSDAGVSVDDYDDEDYEDEDDDDDTDDGDYSDADEVEHADQRTVADVYDEMTDEQKMVVAWYVQQALDQAKEEVAQSDFYEGDYNDMRQNVFENGSNSNAIELSHSEISEIIKMAKDDRDSLARVFDMYLDSEYMAHADDDPEYGIDGIEVLFPDAKSYATEPVFLKREDSWVAKVLNGIKHRPFSRIKTTYADITADEARAKGYVKGNKKIEEVFEVLGRTTEPTTVYKKQKLDRDDKLDITDFDVLDFLKKEMRMMLNEELARAILIGDGRNSMSADKIKESNIRPIVSDDDIYAIKVDYETKAVVSDADEYENAKRFIKQAIKARKNYKGSGKPVLFTTEDMVTSCLLIEDALGRPIYDTEEKLRTKLRVSDIITVPVMEGFTITEDGTEYAINGIIVDLNDYVGGADKGGEINMFEGFDIDFNQDKILIETRMSGALVTPQSALILRSTEEEPVDPDAGDEGEDKGDEGAIS